MDKRVMPEERRHVAADNTHGQHGHEHRHHHFRSGVNNPEQTDMQCCRQTSSLVWPVAAFGDVKDDEGTSRGDCQSMPGCKPCIGYFPDKSAKQDA